LLSGGWFKLHGYNESVKHEILYGPAFACARVMLDPGESVRAESGAMVSMSPTVTMESKMQGGLGKALGRLIGGESLFQTTYTASHGAGEVLFAPGPLGDIVAVRLDGNGMMVTSGGYLAGDVGLELETKAQLKNLFSGEGLFMVRVAGRGDVLISSFGAIHAVQLAPGQPYIVDTGHIVAFSDNMNFNVQRAARSIWGSMTSGEGIVCHFTGPGLLYVQTRSPQSFAPWLGQFLPSRS
jgi:uncharacterized protein (TIGR00266 family)